MKYLFILLFSMSCIAQDSTTISYFRLNEFVKYVAFKDSTENIFSQYKREAELLDSVIKKKDQKIDLLMKSTIPTLEKLNVNNENQLSIIKSELVAEKKKKWSWLGLGAGAGVISGIILSILLSQ